MKPKVTVEITQERVSDADSDVSYLEQEGFEQRLDDYNNGRFSHIGIRARAKISIPQGRHQTVITIESPGLWGIETDSDESYLESIFRQERKILLDLISTLQNSSLVFCYSNERTATK
jgi:hypothetical protein